MKRIQLLMILCVLLVSVCSSFRQSSPTVMHTYAFASYNSSLNRYYFQKDLTALGYVEGINYLCNVQVGQSCRFYADPSSVQYDGTHYYFNGASVFGLHVDRKYVEF